MSEYFGRSREPVEPSLDSHYLNKRIEYSEMSSIIKINAMKIDGALRSASQDMSSLTQRLNICKQKNEQLKKKTLFLETKLKESTAEVEYYKDTISRLEHKVNTLQQQNGVYTVEASRLKTEFLLASSARNENLSTLHNYAQGPTSHHRDSVVCNHFKVPSKQSVLRQNFYSNYQANTLSSSIINQEPKLPTRPSNAKPLTGHHEYNSFESIIKASKENRNFR